jgi:outer membrane protein
VACALALLPAWASAQNLRELYEAARAYDATYLAARALADSANYRAAQADALNRPNVGLSASATRTDADVPSTVTTPNRTAIPFTSGHFFNNRIDGSVSATQPLYNRGNDAIITQAQRGLEVSLADLESAEQDLIVRVAQAYFDVLAAYDALVTSQTGKKAIAEQLASAKRNFEVGTATITDTHEAQARFDLTSAQEIVAQNAVDTQIRQLQQVAGKVYTQLRPVRAEVKLSPPSPNVMQSWVDLAEKQGYPVVILPILAE